MLEKNISKFNFFYKRHLFNKRLLRQVEEYVQELNSLESRRGRKELDVNNVIYWFKNTRAAVKRAEMKTRSISTASTCTALGSNSKHSRYGLIEVFVWK